MWFTPRGMQLMSWPDLSPFLPPALAEEVSAFIATLDEASRKRLSRALDSIMNDVADEWEERIGDLDGEAAFEHALPRRPLDVVLSGPLQQIEDVVDLLERLDLRWRGDAASTLQLHYLEDFEGYGPWYAEEPDDAPVFQDRQRGGQTELVSASIKVLRKNSPVTGVVRDPDDGEWLFFAERDDWDRGITSAPTSWEEMLARDESLAELRELPLGNGAWRVGPEAPWQTVGSLADLADLQRSRGSRRRADGRRGGDPDGCAAGDRRAADADGRIDQSSP
jgi:hypothetical protein